MALFFAKPDGSRAFHVNENESYALWRKMRQWHDVYEVQADGHELELIKQTFTNIPMANIKVVVWTGETAQFIARNLVSLSFSYS